MPIYNIRLLNDKLKPGDARVAARNPLGLRVGQFASVFGISLLTLAACVTAPGDNFNPFKNTGGTSLPFMSECTKMIGGECYQATCKEDATSNCSDFAKGCLNNDGYYKGSGEGGTCSRIL